LGEEQAFAAALAQIEASHLDFAASD